MKRTLPLKRTRAFIAMAGGIVYKQVPDWLNAKFWANPENFGKYWW